MAEGGYVLGTWGFACAHGLVRGSSNRGVTEVCGQFFYLLGQTQLSSSFSYPPVTPASLQREQLTPPAVACSWAGPPTPPTSSARKVVLTCCQTSQCLPCCHSLCCHRLCPYFPSLCCLLYSPIRPLAGAKTMDLSRVSWYAVQRWLFFFLVVDVWLVVKSVYSRTGLRYTFHLILFSMSFDSSFIIPISLFPHSAVCLLCFLQDCFPISCIYLMSIPNLYCEFFI